MMIRTLVAGGVVLTFASASFAQTSSDLMLKAMPKGRRAEAQTSFQLFNTGSTDNDASIQLNRLDVEGRLRIKPDFIADPRLGFDLAYFDLNSPDPGLPDQLIDTSFALGSGVAQYDGWVAGMTVGLGYAGAGAFDDANAWYGLATLIVGREINETDSFGIVIDYNGNRSILPDVPLPGFQYRKTLDPTILLGIGFPFTSVTWKPNDQFTLDLTWNIPDAFRVDVDYKLAENFSLFVQLRDEINAFSNDGFDNSNRRMLFYQSLIEGGVRFTANDTLSLVIAGGYAWNQSFRSGWDTRDTVEVADISDEPFGRIAVELRY